MDPRELLTMTSVLLEKGEERFIFMAENSENENKQRKMQDTYKSRQKSYHCFYGHVNNVN